MRKKNIIEKHNPTLRKTIEKLIVICKKKKPGPTDFITQAFEIICLNENLDRSDLDEDDILVRLHMAIEFWISPESREAFENNELKEKSGVPAKIAKAVKHIAEAEISIIK